MAHEDLAFVCIPPNISAEVEFDMQIEGHICGVSLHCLRCGLQMRKKEKEDNIRDRWTLSWADRNRDEAAGMKLISAILGAWMYMLEYIVNVGEDVRDLEVVDVAWRRSTISVTSKRAKPNLGSSEIWHSIKNFFNLSTSTWNHSFTQICCLKNTAISSTQVSVSLLILNVWSMRSCIFYSFSSLDRTLLFLNIFKSRFLPFRATILYKTCSWSISRHF